MQKQMSIASSAVSGPAAVPKSVEKKLVRESLISTHCRLPRGPARRPVLRAGCDSCCDADHLGCGRHTGASRLQDRKSTRLNSSHRCISYAVFCLKKKKIKM